MVIDRVHHPQDVQEKIVKIIKQLGLSSFQSQPVQQDDVAVDDTEDDDE